MKTEVTTTKVRRRKERPQQDSSATEGTSGSSIRTRSSSWVIFGPNSTGAGTGSGSAGTENAASSNDDDDEYEEVEVEQNNLVTDFYVRKVDLTLNGHPISSLTDPATELSDPASYMNLMGNIMLVPILSSRIIYFFHCSHVWNAKRQQFHQRDCLGEL